MNKFLLCRLLPFAIFFGSVFTLNAQILPEHETLRILVISDEVNPHNLSDTELTQPGDISAALNGTSALNTSVVDEIATNDIEQSIAALNLPKDDPLFYDVVIYFAHRIPNNGANAQQRQEEFVVSIEHYLSNGGGVISFHHGIYRTTGKQSVQALFGAEAIGSVPWNTNNGQDIIYVGGENFIGSHQINYDLQIPYEHSEHGIEAQTYPAFNNTPDERYPQMDFIDTNDNCELNILYESDYFDNGDKHLLSYLKHCPNWKSQVFVYQSGEYQPHAFTGNNFQILLNAIYYLSDFRWDVIFANQFD